MSSLARGQAVGYKIEMRLENTREIEWVALAKQQLPDNRHYQKQQSVAAPGKELVDPPRRATAGRHERCVGSAVTSSGSGHAGTVERDRGANARPAPLPGASLGNPPRYRGQSTRRRSERSRRHGRRALRLRVSAYLIRPDGYIRFRCPIGEVSRKLPPHLAALFGDPVIGAAPPDRQAD